jgi:hypothetical protein
MLLLFVRLQLLAKALSEEQVQGVEILPMTPPEYFASLKKWC